MLITEKLSYFGIVILCAVSCLSHAQCLEGNCENGKGKFIWEEGDVYDGDWRADKQEGKGKLMFSNGDVYEGDWKADKKEGKGKYIYANGDVYTGNYVNDTRTGKGVKKYTDGTIESGTFENGKFVKGVITGTDGKKSKYGY